MVSFVLIFWLNNYFPGLRAFEYWRNLRFSFGIEPNNINTFLSNYISITTVLYILVCDTTKASYAAIEWWWNQKTLIWIWHLVIYQLIIRRNIFFVEPPLLSYVKDDSIVSFKCLQVLRIFSVVIISSSVL